MFTLDEHKDGDTLAMEGGTLEVKDVYRSCVSWLGTDEVGYWIGPFGFVQARDGRWDRGVWDEQHGNYRFGHGIQRSRSEKGQYKTLEAAIKAERGRWLKAAY